MGPRILAVLVLVGAACAGAPGAPRGVGPSASPSPPSVLPTGAASPGASASPALSAAATPAACRAIGQEVASWTVARKAAEVVAVPSLDFDIEQLGGPLSAGAGGVLFLGSAPAPADLGSRVSAAAVLAPSNPPGVPAPAGPLVMADEEGGGVQRLAGLVGAIPWPRQMAASDTPAQVTALATGIARQMKAAGVGMDLAPVLDVDGGAGPSATDPDGSRSFSATPSVAAAYGEAFVRGLEAGGVIPVAKHFPGLGGATGNTDDGPAATPPLATLQAQGLVPFETAIRGGVPAVMVANATVPGLTALPASLSPAAVSGLLRTTLGFTGLVLTDSLSAGAVAAAGYPVPAAAVAALGAGADLVLFGSTLTPADTAALAPAQVAVTFTAVVSALVAAAGSGELAAGRLDTAATHVLQAQAGLIGACG